MTVPETPQNIQNDTWQEVLVAVDKTYAELVDYQERLETQNQELTALRRFMSSVLASISDYLLVINRNGEITEAGEAICQALNAPLEEIRQLKVDDIYRTAGEAPLNTHLAAVIAARQTVTIKASLARGTCEPVELRMAPQMDRRSKVIGAVLTARPMGELHRAFTELEQSHEELKQAQVQLVRNEKLASLGRLLAGVAHELNNPISFVYANTHAMEKYIDRFETYFEQVEAGAPRADLIALRGELRLDRNLRNLRTALDGSREGAKRVRDLVEDLRRLSADGSGEFERFDLVETTRDALRWIERGANQRMAVEYRGDAQVFARGRVGHIQQVLLNLLQNAADALEAVEAPKLVLEFTADDDWARLVLHDNGPGVAPDKVAQIFDPFFTTKEVGRGTGLGLSISHKIIEEHGGELRYVDTGSGACFQLSLPAKMAG